MKFRIITDKYNWTMCDDIAQDATVFLSNHLYKSPANNHNFLMTDRGSLISLDEIIAIEVLE